MPLQINTYWEVQILTTMTIKRRTLVGGMLIGALLASTASVFAQSDLESELVVRASGGSIGTALRAVIEDFQAETGVQVTYAESTSAAAIAAIKAAGGQPDSDVVFINATEAVTIKNEGLYEPIDPAAMSNYADTYENTRDPGNVWLPTGISAIAPAYNAEVFAQQGLPPIESWEDLWRPELKDHIAFTTLANSGFTKGFFWWLQNSLGGADAAFAKMEELKPNITALTQASGQAEDLYKQGAAWVMINGNTRIWALEATGVPVTMAVPKEGLIALPQGWFVPKGAAHPKAATAFLNYMLSPEVQQAMATTVFYGPVNSKAELPEDVAAKVPYGPEQIANLVQPDWTALAGEEKTWIERWTQEIEAN